MHCPVPLARLTALLALASLPAWSLTPPAAAAAEPSATYTVQPGDTLISLGRTVLVSAAAWNEVARLNQLPDPDRIYPRQALTIPLRLLRNTAPPARLTSVEGDVRLNGQPAKAGDAWPVGQPLTAGSNSSAAVQLGDGSRLQLAPQSEALLNEHRRYASKAGLTQATGTPPPQAAASEGLFAASLRLLGGAVEVAASKVMRARPLEVVTPTAVIGTRGTEYRVHHDESLATRTEVLEGRVRADVQEARPGAPGLAAPGADVSAGFGAALQANRAPQVVALPPAPDLRQLATVLEQPRLTLQVPPGTLPMMVQVASDARFDHVVRSQLVAPGGTLSLAGLADGEWQLRARQIDALGIWGLDGLHPFTLRQLGEAPQLIPHTASQPAGRQQLAWHPVSGKTRYLLELSPDPAFATEVYRTEVRQTTAFSLILALPGHHHWRVASLPDDDGPRGAWSDTGLLEIQAQDPTPR